MVPVSLRLPQMLCIQKCFPGLTTTFWERQRVNQWFPQHSEQQAVSIRTPAASLGSGSKRQGKSGLWEYRREAHEEEK